jgi:nitrite reductase/ring-hydroxylating ferredoxin subunit
VSGLVDVDARGPVGTVVPATLDGEPVAIVRHEGGWVAVPDRCPHAGCQFTEDGEVLDGTTLVCNCHGSEFDLRTGEVLLGPAETGLELTALVQDGRLLRRLTV